MPLPVAEKKHKTRNTHSPLYRYLVYFYTANTKLHMFPSPTRTPSVTRPAAQRCTHQQDNPPNNRVRFVCTI